MSNSILSDRIINNCIPEPNSGCWLWLLRVDRNGYGRIKVGGIMKGAHRISYECFSGEIPEGALICHSCDTPSCVNPDHLQVGDWQKNMDDKVRRGRARSGHGESRKDSKLTDEAVSEIRTMRISMIEFGKLYGVSPTTINSARIGKSWSWHNAPLSNVDHLRKINEADVYEILKREKTQAKYAKQFGVSFSLVSQIQRGRVWKHITCSNGGSL